MEEEIELIEQLDNDLASWEAEFLAALIAVNARVLDGLETLLSQLNLKGQATTSEEMRSNMRIVVMWRSEILDLVVNRSGLQVAVRKLSERMGQSADVLNSYYSALDISFSPEPYRSLLENLTSQTIEMLTGPTVDSVYGQTLYDTLTSNILTKSTAAQVRAVLRENLQEHSTITRTIGTMASDALYTFSRGYSMAVADGLNLKHFYYMGTIIDNSRKWCIDKCGKAYTQKQVEEWADQSWSGKNPATTKKTIFWYCGGYRCKHRLLPVSKSMFNQFQNKN